MADITFDIAAFRANFPAFASETAYPDETLQSFWDAATCYISATNYGYLNGDCRARALMLMTAHLIEISNLAKSGQATGVITSSTIDKISVAMQAPPSTNAWQYWLSITPYGMQLRALLEAKSVGGFYIGGSPERSAFRKVYGCF